VPKKKIRIGAETARRPLPSLHWRGKRSNDGETDRYLLFVDYLARYLIWSFANHPPAGVSCTRGACQAGTLAGGSTTPIDTRRDRPLRSWFFLGNHSGSFGRGVLGARWTGARGEDHRAPPHMADHHRDRSNTQSVHLGPTARRWIGVARGPCRGCGTRFVDPGGAILGGISRQDGGTRRARVGGAESS